MRNDPGIVSEALRNGAAGYVVKEASPHELVAAVETVAAGKPYISKHIKSTRFEPPGNLAEQLPITPREETILRLGAEGATSSEIARHFSISPRTVEMHRANLMRKLNLGSQTELVRFAIRNKIVNA